MLNKELLKAVRPFRFVLSDTTCPMLGVRYSYHPATDDPNSPKPYCSVQIDANGSDTDSTLIVLVNIGSSSTVYDQYQFSASAAAIADPDGLAASVTHTTCATLGAAITAINALEGVSVWRLNAPADLTLAAATFIDLAKTQIGNKLDQEILYQDASETDVLYGRIGFPKTSAGLNAGFLDIVRLSAYGNVGSGTSTLTVQIDPDEVDATQEADWLTFDVADAAVTECLEEYQAPPAVQGPILITMSGTTLAENAYVQVDVRTCDI